MSNPTLHDEALRRLCFVCAKLLKQKDRRFKVEEYLEMLSKALDQPSGVVVMEGVTPIHFCLSCKLSLQKICSGKQIRTNLHVRSWYDCQEDCGTCNYLNTRKMGGGYKKVSFAMIHTFSIRITQIFSIIRRQIFKMNKTGFCKFYKI